MLGLLPLPCLILHLGPKFIPFQFWFSNKILRDDEYTLGVPFQLCHVNFQHVVALLVFTHGCSHQHEALFEPHLSFDFFFNTYF